MTNHSSSVSNRKSLQARVPLVFALTLFFAAFAIRLMGIQWGLPDNLHHFSFHPDEWLILLASYYNMNPMQGDFLPGFYNYGSLPLTLWSAWLHLLIPGAQSTVEAVSSLHWMARLLTALMGAATAVVVFQTGRQLGGMGTGAIAGLIMAIAPAHVVHSRFQTVDVPTTLFVALACLCAVRLYDTPHLLKTLVWGAFWAGCAAGSKYNAGLVILALYVSLYLRSRHEPLSTKSLLSYAGLATGVTLLTFLLACPGAWLDREAFWRNFMYEVRHVQSGHGDIFTDTGWGWVYHLWNLKEGFGLWALLLAIAGWIVAWKHFPAARGVFIAALAYFLLIGAAEVRFLRYTFPLYPALALGVAILFSAKLLSSALRESLTKLLPPAVRGGLTRLLPPAVRGKVGKGVQNQPPLNPPVRGKVGKGGQWAVIFATIIAVLQQATLTFGFTYAMTRTDTRIQCVRWFQARVPEGKSIAFATVPWFYTPPFFPDTGELRWQDRLERMQQAQSPYRLISLAPPDWNTERLLTEMPDYIVLTEFEYTDAERLQRQDYERFMEAVQEHYTLAQTFVNEPLPLRKSRYTPHDLLYIYPDVRVYRRK